jgi:hypothetical protein
MEECANVRYLYAECIRKDSRKIKFTIIPPECMMLEEYMGKICYQIEPRNYPKK